jgi:hypothetical protein
MNIWGGPNALSGGQSQAESGPGTWAERRIKELGVDSVMCWMVLPGQVHEKCRS